MSDTQGTQLAPMMAAPEPHEDAAKKPDRKHAEMLREWIESPNIAVDLGYDERNKIAFRVKSDYEIDEESRAEWLDNYKKWLRFAMQSADPKTYPWPGACYSLDTDILTDRGWLPVADVKVGDLVYSRGPDKVAAYYPVTETFRHKSDTMVHFKGKSIDLLVTPNHKMLVESKFDVRRKQHFIEASRFLEDRLAFRYIPLTSTWVGENTDTIHGIDAKAYVRFLGWYISEGSGFTGRNVHTLKDGTVKDYGLSPSSYAIAQKHDVNAEKCGQIRRDLKACGFGYSETDSGFIVHARTMPQAVKDELKSLGTCEHKHIPSWAFKLSAPLLRELLDTLVMGDGHARMRPGKTKECWTYYTTSPVLAGQIQELCQKIGLRGTVCEKAPCEGGVIKGRQITGSLTSYAVHINTKTRIQIVKMDRCLITEPQEVACVAVEPHHTVYVRRNGKAVWCGNSNVIYPLITTAALQFHARSYPSIIQDKNVVKGEVVGPDDGDPMIDQRSGQPVMGQDGQPVFRVPPGAKQKRADRVGQHMSWQLLSDMEEWEPQTDRLLIVTPIVGTMFRKTYYDPGLLRNVSETVTADLLCVNYNAKSFETAPRMTEIIQLYPWQIEEKIRGGLFLDEDYGNDQDSGRDEDAPITFLEQHRRWDLDGDGYDEPYIVTIAKDSCRLARITAGYDMDTVMFGPDHRVRKIDPVPYYTKYGFIPSPDNTVYDIGFGHLLYPINDAINTTLNQMFDAGHLANAGGGFIGDGLSMNTGAVRFQVGEYKSVSVTAGTLRDNVMPLPFAGPSPVLFQMLGFLVEAGREVASVKDVLSGDMGGANIQATTMLAMIEQGLRVYSAIQKRILRALKAELNKLFRLNRLYLPQTTGYLHGGQWNEVRQSDYQAGSGVEPISDPTMLTDMQRMGRAQFLLQFATDPLFDPLEVRRRVLSAAQVDGIDKLLVQQAPPNPQAQAQAAELQLEARALDLKQRELAIRGAREAGDLDIRRGKDKAVEIRELSQAILNLANAKKADAEADMGWVDQQMRMMQAQIEALNAGNEPTEDNPALPAGTASGDVSGAVQSMAAPPGNGGLPPMGS